MIRQATTGDIPAIKALMQSEAGFWQPATRPDALEVALASAGDLALVWEEAEELLGFACAHDLGFRGYLSELIVAPGGRGRGIGRALVGHIEDALQRRACPALIADVWRDAESFYRALGWSEPDVVLLRQPLLEGRG